MIVKCRTCGHVFDNKGKSNKNYCSNFCANEGKEYKHAASLPMDKKTDDCPECVICGKKMAPSQRGMDRKYCSDECKRVARKEYLAKYYKQNYHAGNHFYEARRTSAALYQQRGRAEGRERAMRGLAEKLYGKNIEEMIEILESNVRSMKS